MKAQRPYLYKAIYEWIIDNGWTPHLLVDTNIKGVAVPASFVKDGRIVLNVSLSATSSFFQDEQGIAFSARFSGTSENLVIPYAAMIALYARENAQGLVFPFEDIYQVSSPVIENAEDDGKPEPEGKRTDKKSKPTLTLIK